MTTTERDRLVRVIRALEKALAIFRGSRVKAGVGDIEAESHLSLLRDELQALVAVENPRQRH